MIPLLPGAVRERRLAAYTAEWNAIRRSTEPADHERAERAIAELYAERGLATPEVLWVPSPAAAVIAWHVASRGRPPVRNLYTRGEVGTGRSRDVLALDDPFGLPSGNSAPSSVPDRAYPARSPPSPCPGPAPNG